MNPDPTTVLEHGFNVNPDNVVATLVGLLIFLCLVLGWGLVKMFLKLMAEKDKYAALAQSQHTSQDTALNELTESVKRMSRYMKDQFDLMKQFLTIKHKDD